MLPDPVSLSRQQFPFGLLLLNELPALLVLELPAVQPLTLRKRRNGACSWHKAAEAGAQLPVLGMPSEKSTATSLTLRMPRHRPLQLLQHVSYGSVNVLVSGAGTPLVHDQIEPEDCQLHTDLIKPSQVACHSPCSRTVNLPGLGRSCLPVLDATVRSPLKESQDFSCGAPA